MYDQLRSFVDSFDFEALMVFFTTITVNDLIVNPYVLVPVIIIIGLISYNKTAYIGQQLLLYVPAVAYLFITVIILKNDNITATGPFLMAMVAFFLVAGWFIWTKLLGD
ncbi:MAG: hypothetical protein HY751_00570 [Nitrospinae bacterium]|nr:hypothetical protein [Nitrospinota bacterium]